MFGFLDRKEKELWGILKHYGPVAQRFKAIEETAEYQRALARWHMERSAENYRNLEEEIADVLITMTQMALEAGINEDSLYSVVTQKIKRTLERMSEGD